ncbi:MAG: DUF4340 domain-containing protein [Treponemataceae bacterium]|nr:DUF4340 domain-containing protein [Treponemataceae bacterium]
MKKRKIYFIISIYCIVLSILCIAGTLRRETNFTGRTLQSALLNEKYKSAVNKIRITFPQENSKFIFELNLEKSKEDDFWTGTISESNSFVADRKTVSKLFDIFCSTRNLILLSESISDWNQFGLSEEEAVCIAFYESKDGTDLVRSKLFFGRNTTDYSGVYVRNDKNPYIYRVEDNVSAYLTADTKFWSDLSLFRQDQESDETSFIKISVSMEDDKGTLTKKNIYNDGKDAFFNYTHKLLSLRGSDIMFAPADSLSYMKKILELEISGQNSSASSVQVFSSGPVSDTDCRFFVKYSSQEEMDIPPYFIEISSWTYRNLLPDDFI